MTPNIEQVLEPDGIIRGNLTLVSAWLCPRDDQLQPLPPRLPLNLVYLASAAVRAGYRVAVRDLQFVDVSSDLSIRVSELAYQALENAGPFVGISCMSDMLPFIVIAVQRWKRLNPQSVVVFGGSGATSAGRVLLLTVEEIDAIVLGEGEQTLVELLDAYYGGQGFDDVLGISFRREKQVISNPPRPRLAILDGLLPLRYLDFPLGDYYNALPIATARGCPFQCTFCSTSHIWGRQTTWHSVERIKGMLLELASTSNGRFVFTDDTFVLQRRRVIAFCDSLEGRNIQWHCNGRIDLMDDALLLQMAKAGCPSIFYGIESGSASLLEGMHKGFTSAQALAVVSQSCQYISNITVSFIWGFPNESWEDFQLTRELYLKMSQFPGVTVQINLLNPYPLVTLYDRYKDQLFLDVGIPSIAYPPGRKLVDEEVALISRSPELFPCFYRFPTPNLERKLETIERDRNQNHGL